MINHVTLKFVGFAPTKLQQNNISSIAKCGATLYIQNSWTPHDLRVYLSKTILNKLGLMMHVDVIVGGQIDVVLTIVSRLGDQITVEILP